MCVYVCFPYIRNPTGHILFVTTLGPLAVFSPISFAQETWPCELHQWFSKTSSSSIRISIDGFLDPVLLCAGAVGFHPHRPPSDAQDIGWVSYSFPPTSAASHKPRLSHVFLMYWPKIRGSHSPSLSLTNLLEHLTTLKHFTYYITGLL